MVLMNGPKSVSHYPPPARRLTQYVYDRTFSASVQQGIHVLSQFTHITDMVRVMKYDNPMGFHNVIVNIFHVILEGGPMLAPHDFHQL